MKVAIKDVNVITLNINIPSPKAADAFFLNSSLYFEKVFKFFAVVVFEKHVWFTFYSSVVFKEGFVF